MISAERAAADHSRTASRTTASQDGGVARDRPGYARRVAPSRAMRGRRTAGVPSSRRGTTDCASRVPQTSYHNLFRRGGKVAGSPYNTTPSGSRSITIAAYSGDTDASHANTPRRSDSVPRHTRSEGRARGPAVARGLYDRLDGERPQYSATVDGRGLPFGTFAPKYSAPGRDRQRGPTHLENCRRTGSLGRAGSVNAIPFAATKQHSANASSRWSTH